MTDKNFNEENNQEENNQQDKSINDDNSLNCDNVFFDFSDQNEDNIEVVSNHSESIISEREEVNNLEAPDDSEIELDPAIEEIKVETDKIEDYVSPTPEDPFAEEPLAPVMPIIQTNPYVEKKSEKSNKGVKVFSLILAFLIVASVFMSGGYFLGNYNKKTNVSAATQLEQKPTPDKALTSSQIYENVNKSIVGIYVYNSSGIKSSASGVIYSEDGYIVTNDHIYSEAQNAEFKVYTSDGTCYSADFVAGDTRSDLAVLKVRNPKNFVPAVFGDSSQINVGETVVAVGKPNGAAEQAIASEGIISAASRRVSITSSYTGVYIQTDSAINPGSSGGALCNIYGQVIGITSAKIVGDEYEGVGFAIPTTVMKKNVDLLIKYKFVKGRAKLGISYIAVDELSAEINNSPVGLQIATIDESSDLFGKSVAAGDIITKVNGTEIKDSSVILDVIDSKNAGDTINLTIYSVKGKNSFDISVKLLEDKGGSSYTSEEDTSKNQSGNNKKEDNEYNQSEFNFPIGD